MMRKETYEHPPKKEEEEEEEGNIQKRPIKKK